MYKSISAMVGHTPIISLERLVTELGLEGSLYAKCEFLNPTGSMKDRIALSMIMQAEKEGKLQPGGTIIEPTSGNTGIGLAAIGAQRGYRVVICMPESMSIERRKMMQIYGAELVLTPAAQGMKGAIAKAEALVQESENAILAGQFINPANPQVHYETTGPEIYEELGDTVEALVAGVGTGGSLTGVGRFYKEKVEGFRVTAVEPAGSPVLSGGQAGTHAIQGIGAGFAPDVLDLDIVDEIYQAKDQEAVDMVRTLSRTEGLFCGISSGAALLGALDYLRQHPGSKVLTILPDTGTRYLSSPLLFPDMNA